MRQLSYPGHERRKHPRQTRAFAFWFRRIGDQDRTSAWMLDTSAVGAAFLTPTSEVPAVGQLLELSEMQTADRVVREDALPLPGFARVMRHDGIAGVTSRVAVRFESNVEAALEVDTQRSTAACRPRSQVAPSPPPPVGVGDELSVPSARRQI